MRVPELREALDRYVRPGTYPVAVAMLEEGAPLPDRAKRPKADLGIEVAVCQTITMARRYGWVLAVGREDLNCPLTRVAFGFDPPIPFYTKGHVACDMYVGSLQAGERSEAAVPRFEQGRYRHLVVAPLHRTSFHPDVIVLYGDAAQVMLLVVAALYREGGRLTSSFGGRIDCADLIIQPMLENRPQVVLPCYGDRVFGGCEDHEMAFTFPAAMADQMVDGLDGAHRGGVRYPIPKFLRYQGEFPPRYRELDVLLREGADGRSSSEETA